MIRALATGSVAGLAIFTVLVWAFAKGCPIFDVEHDSILGF